MKTVVYWKNQTINTFKASESNVIQIIGRTIIIYKKEHFLPKFSQNGGHFGYLDFSKYVFSNGFYWDVCTKGFLRNNYLFHGINTEK